MSNIAISVVVPAYNEEKRIASCLKSLSKQDFKYPYEIILVNNASTDNTKSIAKKFPKVTIIDEPEKGVAIARQRGFSEAKAKLIASTDADCIVPKTWLSQMYKSFEDDKNLVAIGGYWLFYDSNLFNTFNKIGNYLNIVNLIAIFIDKQPLSTQNMTVKKEFFIKSGGFNTKIKSPLGLDDVDFSTRLSQYGKVKVNKNILIKTSARRFKQKPLETTYYRIMNYITYATKKTGYGFDKDSNIR